jgi:hypothetical protein
MYYRQSEALGSPANDKTDKGEFLQMTIFEIGVVGARSMRVQGCGLITVGSASREPRSASRLRKA